MGQDTFFASAAESVIALVPARHVELPGDVQHLVQLLRRRLVGERGRRTDPDLRRLAHAGRGPHAWQAAEPVRMQLQPPHHHVDQRHLEIEGGLVAGDPVFAESLQNRADVLVLELDRSLRPVVQKRQERPAMLRLAVAAPGNVVGQPSQVSRDNHVRFFIHPRAARHAARLEARCASVINGLAWAAAD